MLEYFFEKEILLGPLDLILFSITKTLKAIKNIISPCKLFYKKKKTIFAVDNIIFTTDEKVFYPSRYIFHVFTYLM
jgi:hypothetical protein